MSKGGFKIWGKSEKWFLVAVLVLVALLIAYNDNLKTVPAPDSVYCAVYGCN